MLFGRGSGGRGVFKEAAHRKLSEHFVLNTMEDFGEVDLAGVGFGWHGGFRSHRRREFI